MNLLTHLQLRVPIFQAPMAGVSTPELAAEVSNAGGLGSIAIGAVEAGPARQMIDATRALTDRAFNVNVFAHHDPLPDPARETEWLDALRPLFEKYNAHPPARLTTIYKSFARDDAMLALLLETAPRVVSFHFGLPDADRLRALKQAGCLLLASATNLEEAHTIERAGLDGIIAQGYEAGGHRGMFDPDAPDDKLGTLALTRLLALNCNIPIISAGGIMDGAGIRAVLALGAVAAQLGTAFIACPESSADAAYRAALKGPGAEHTILTRAISGRPARCLANRFTDWGTRTSALPPAYPIAYDAGKALNAAAKAQGETGFAAQWAGQGAPLHRSMPTADLIKQLEKEISATD